MLNILAITHTNIKNMNTQNNFNASFFNLILPPLDIVKVTVQNPARQTHSKLQIHACSQSLCKTEIYTSKSSDLKLL